MELNLKNNANALLSPYRFIFCDDNSIPTGGQKLKETPHNMFNRVFRMAEFNGATTGGTDNLGSQLGNLLQRMFVNRDAARTTKTFGGDGNQKHVCPMSTRTRTFFIPMRKSHKSCVWVAHVTIYSQRN